MITVRMWWLERMRGHGPAWPRGRHQEKDTSSVFSIFSGSTKSIQGGHRGEGWGFYRHSIPHFSRRQRETGVSKAVSIYLIPALCPSASKDLKSGKKPGTSAVFLTAAGRGSVGWAEWQLSNCHRAWDLLLKVLWTPAEPGIRRGLGVTWPSACPVVSGCPALSQSSAAWLSVPGLGALMMAYPWFTSVTESWQNQKSELSLAAKIIEAQEKCLNG